MYIINDTYSVVEGKADMTKMTLKDIQDCELDMMIIFDEVCRKYKLRYSLCAGTLIGAVRHQGFIPWDDDIDISMPRPDYEKLIRLNRKRKLWPEHIRFASLEDGTLDAPFIKLFDVRTKVKEKNFTQGDVKCLWLDVFPADGLPESRFKTKLHYKVAFFLCKLNVASVVNKGYGTSKLKIIFKTVFFSPLAKLIGRQRIARMQRRWALRYSYKKSPRCGMVTWAYDGPDQALPKEEYENRVLMPFEDKEFYVMSGWDKNLTGIFGDYMTLPPEEDRENHELEAYYV